MVVLGVYIYAASFLPFFLGGGEVVFREVPVGPQLCTNVSQK